MLNLILGWLTLCHRDKYSYFFENSRILNVKSESV